MPLLKRADLVVVETLLAELALDDGQVPLLDHLIAELGADTLATGRKNLGEIFVFVDECHRTQSGKLHKVMKAMMPDAVFIGFTGTPLLAKDKATSLEVFGGSIHTYKFSEGIADGIILDLVYEARDIDQHLGSQDKIDAWFEAKTRGLNDWQREELKAKWGTLQNVLISRFRMDRVVSKCAVVKFATRNQATSVTNSNMTGRGSHLGQVTVGYTRSTALTNNFSSQIS